MTRKTLNYSALLAGTALLGLASPLAAQSQEQEKGEARQISTTNVEGQDAEAAIVVTGTRIRGTQAVGDVTTISREMIVEAGQVDLGEAIRSLPQNFSGGQNPGVGSGAGLVNSNISSASSANLRGLGPDATLTLLNGHRLPYNSAFQGIDISAIPLAAVDRVEVVPDGASALYGSDAVGGVINVLLRRDFDGIATSAQLGRSTGGGNFRQQADVVAGKAWDRGGFLLAYDFANNSGITAKQRSYASSLREENTLFPSMQRHAVTLNAHHDFAPGVEISIDALYSQRDSSIEGGTTSLNRLFDSDLEGYTFAPSLRVDLGSRWEAQLLGIFGRDRTRFQNRLVPQSGTPRESSGHYFNEITSVEGGVEGPLFDLPGGEARIAAGAGIRENRLDHELFEDASGTGFDARQRARFAYAELHLPLISSENEIAGIRRFTISAAIRHEDYPGLDELTTPRVAAKYSPFEGVTLRGSWARSFKAPTLFQQHTFYEAILLPAAIFGAGTGTDTVLITAGGNPDVRPERARSWTAGIEVRPESLPGLLVTATWYDISYTDRVTRPIVGPLRSAFADPGFASLIDNSPDPDKLAALIDGAQLGLQNFTGAIYDPATVAALVDNRNINVAAWSIDGIDARIAWSRVLDQNHELGFDLSGSWIDSKQRITSQLPEVELAGRIFNPPDFRLRGTARLEAGRLSANAAINYTGNLVDARFAEEQELSPTATFDVGLTYTAIGERNHEPGLQFSLTVQNLLNKKPEIIGQTGPTDTPFDSTNYSPIGRFIAFGLRRHW